LQFLPSVLGGFVQPEGLRTLSSTFSGDRIELRNLVIRPEVRSGVGRLGVCHLVIGMAHHRMAAFVAA
jgi:hypothetical protein